MITLRWVAGMQERKAFKGLPKDGSGDPGSGYVEKEIFESGV